MGERRSYDPKNCVMTINGVEIEPMDAPVESPLDIAARAQGVKRQALSPPMGWCKCGNPSGAKTGVWSRDFQAYICQDCRGACPPNRKAEDD